VVSSLGDYPRAGILEREIHSFFCCVREADEVSRNVRNFSTWLSRVERTDDEGSVGRSLYVLLTVTCDWCCNRGWNFSPGQTKRRTSISKPTQSHSVFVEDLP